MGEKKGRKTPQMMKKHVYSKLKILHDFGQLASLREGIQIAPKSVRVDLTTRCNHNCYYCFYESDTDGLKGIGLNLNFPKNQDIPSERFIRLIRELEEVGVNAMTLVGGGEPTLHPAFKVIFDSILRSKIDVGIITNGSRLGIFSDNPNSERFKWIRISLDATNEKTWRKIHRHTGAPSFDKVLGQIGRFRLGKADDFVIGLSFVVCRENHDEVYDFVRMAKQLGADNVRLGLVHGTGFHERHEGYILKVREAVRMAKADFDDDAFRLFDQTRRYDNLATMKKDYDDCRFQDISVNIGVDLNLYPCCFTKYSQEYAVASVKDRTFSEAWFEDRKAFRASFDLSRCPPCWYDENNRILEYLLLRDPPHKHFID